MYLAFQSPYVNDHITKVCRRKSEIIHNHENENVRNLLGIGHTLHLCFCNDVSSSARPIKILQHVIIFIEGDDHRVGPELEETIFHRSDYKIGPLEEPACSPDAV
jgi:hypothetical protein